MLSGCSHVEVSGFPYPENSGVLYLPCGLDDKPQDEKVIPCTVYSVSVITKLLYNYIRKLIYSF